MRKKEELAGIIHAQRQIGFKKEMEVEDLKIETLETSMPWEVLEPKGMYIVWKLLRKST